MASNIIWYELLTPDPDAAQKFYSDVLGYAIIPSQNPDMDYRMWQLGDNVLGGLMKLPDEATKMGMQSSWLCYIRVPDVDAAVTEIIADGGKVWMPAVTMDNVGRMALVTDSLGAPFYVMTPSGEGESSCGGQALGQCGWNELHTTDGAAAMAFYTKHFGWVNANTMDMGDMGQYHMFNTGSGDDVGGMMTNTQVPQPGWLFYLNAEDINAAKARVEAAGGKIYFGPQQVPGGQWVITAGDPQGAKFGVVAPQ